MALYQYDKFLIFPFLRKGWNFNKQPRLLGPGLFIFAYSVDCLQQS
ncbi:hypothetical protein DCCM_0805 [Desulfocucumis palustris]|uniref:Uncharacterized protein n=1 Tax=Desulfocucumis palustris TaxID=1898651 RepID=A0A2L2X8R6_9FIRM|nr:hypothetical protein DCCM_0805 [Desulfocucumis palustris]